jgi:hypothetical protein
VANRVTEFVEKALSMSNFGNIKVASRMCVCDLVNIKWFDLNKRGCFL